MMTYLTVAGASLLFFSLVFVVAQIRRNNGLVDVAWGTSFVLSALLSFFVGGTGEAVPIVLTVLVTVWGLRLTYYLGRRNIGKPEDFRYAQMRQNWNPSTFYLRMYVQIYLFQFLLHLLIVLPVVVTNLKGAGTWNAWATAGLAVWVFGFLFESVGDAQLRRFKADPANRGKLMTRGLWSTTRHPNYFGESVQWWGVFLLAAGSGRIWLVESPLVITLLLLFVSGVPMLEKKYAGRPDWEAYKARTPVFFPFFPRRTR